jgi:ABC-type Fe3+ transport system permease subunit
MSLAPSLEPTLLYIASMGGNYQIASITALILLALSVLFMIVIERCRKADVLSKVGQ